MARWWFLVRYVIYESDNWTRGYYHDKAFWNQCLFGGKEVTVNDL